MRPSSSLRVVCRFEAGTEASQLPPQCVDSHCLTLRSSRRILVCLAGSPSRSAAMSADIEPSASYIPVARQWSKIARPDDLLALLRRKRLSPVVRTAPVCRQPWQPICRRPPVDRSSCAARPSWYARRARARQPTPAIGAPHTTLIRARTHPSHRRVFRAVAGLRGDGGRSVAASIASNRQHPLLWTLQTTNNRASGRHHDYHPTDHHQRRDDARFAWDECACHRRSARDRPAMLPCMPCSCSTCS